MKNYSGAIAMLTLGIVIRACSLNATPSKDQILDNTYLFYERLFANVGNIYLKEISVADSEKLKKQLNAALAFIGKDNKVRAEDAVKFVGMYTEIIKNLQIIYKGFRAAAAKKKLKLARTDSLTVAEMINSAPPGVKTFGEYLKLILSFDFMKFLESRDSIRQAAKRTSLTSAVQSKCYFSDCQDRFTVLEAIATNLAELSGTLKASFNELSHEFDLYASL